MKKTDVIILFIFTMGLFTFPSFLRGTYRQENPNSGDHVILLHGLGRNAGSMQKMEQHLAGKGFHVINLDYPSRKHTIEFLTEHYLRETIETRCSDTSKKIHFVTHSMGGIIVRFYLKKFSPRNIGRIVMISPPNGGSEVADFLMNNFFIRRILGPAIGQLGTGKNSVPNSIGAIKYDTGIITGSSSINWINSAIIPGKDDGKVSIKRARLRGMKDFLVVKRSHTFIMKAPEVMEAVYNFLTTGKFNNKKQPHIGADEIKK